MGQCKCTRPNAGKPLPFEIDILANINALSCKPCWIWEQTIFESLLTGSLFRRKLRLLFGNRHIRARHRSAGKQRTHRRHHKHGQQCDQ